METLIRTRSTKHVGDLSHSFIIRNNRSVLFNLVVFDAAGNQFTNFSSVATEWSSSNSVSLTPFTFFVCILSSSSREIKALPHP